MAASTDIFALHFDVKFFEMQIVVFIYDKKYREFKKSQTHFMKSHMKYTLIYEPIYIYVMYICVIYSEKINEMLFLTDNGAK